MTQLQTELAQALGITPDQARDMEQWALRAIPHIEAGMDPQEALILGAQEYQAFIEEMIHCETDRAQMAREVIQADVWAEGQKIGARRRALNVCEGINRKSMGF